MDKIKLLILTQKVDIDDDLLGFMHNWIKEFSLHCEKVTVVCLFKGRYELPENVRVLSLGKEKIKKKLLNCQIIKLFYFVNFFKLIWQERKNYDSVFVHMNHEYVVLGGWLWKLMGKRIVLWHAHKTVNWKLKIAEKFVDKIVTSTKSGCRLKSDKIAIVGQGIDIDKFKVKSEKCKVNEDKYKIITVGRISKIKDYETLIKAIEILNQDKLLPSLAVDIIGGPVNSDDEKYLNELQNTIKEKKLDGQINFIGSIPYKLVDLKLMNADLFVNSSLTGSLDKVVLEAMACGLPILTCNEAFDDVLGEYRQPLMFSKADFKQLADKINFIINMPASDKKKMADDLRGIVAKGHSLSLLIERLINYLK